MKSRVLVVALAVLAPVLVPVLVPRVAEAADDPVKFGEIRNGAIVPTHTIKMCPKSTGYTYGFEILLPEQGSHEVSGDFYWPPPKGVNCVSCAHIQNPYGTHAGRFVKSFSFDPDDQAGAYRLIVVVDHDVVATINFDVVASKDCH
jgi:hypothetical protein